MRERHERFLKWYSKLSPEEQADYDRRAAESWRKAKIQIVFLLALFVGLLVLWGRFLDGARTSPPPQGPPTGYHPMP